MSVYRVRPVAQSLARTLRASSRMMAAFDGATVLEERLLEKEARRASERSSLFSSLKAAYKSAELLQDAEASRREVELPEDAQAILHEFSQQDETDDESQRKEEESPEFLSRGEKVILAAVMRILGGEALPRDYRHLGLLMSLPDEFDVQDESKGEEAQLEGTESDGIESEGTKSEGELRGQRIWAVIDRVLQERHIDLSPIATPLSLRWLHELSTVGESVHSDSSLGYVSNAMLTRLLRRAAAWRNWDAAARVVETLGLRVAQIQSGEIDELSLRRDDTVLPSSPEVWTAVFDTMDHSTAVSPRSAALLLGALIDGAGAVPSVLDLNSALNVCAIHEDAETARHIMRRFDRSGLTPDATSFNLLIRACRKHHPNCAIDFFGGMLEAGIKPDLGTVHLVVEDFLRSQRDTQIKTSGALADDKYRDSHLESPWFSEPAFVGFMKLVAELTPRPCAAYRDLFAMFYGEAPDKRSAAGPVYDLLNPGKVLKEKPVRAEATEQPAEPTDSTEPVEEQEEQEEELTIHEMRKWTSAEWREFDLSEVEAEVLIKAIKKRAFSADEFTERVRQWMLADADESEPDEVPLHVMLECEFRYQWGAELLDRLAGHLFDTNDPDVTLVVLRRLDELIREDSLAQESLLATAATGYPGLASTLLSVLYDVYEKMYDHEASYDKEYARNYEWSDMLEMLSLTGSIVQQLFANQEYHGVWDEGRHRATDLHVPGGDVDNHQEEVNPSDNGCNGAVLAELMFNVESPQARRVARALFQRGDVVQTYARDLLEHAAFHASRVGFDHVAVVRHCSNTWPAEWFLPLEQRVPLFYNKLIDSHDARHPISSDDVARNPYMPVSDVFRPNDHLMPDSLAVIRDQMDGRDPNIHVIGYTRR